MTLDETRNDWGAVVESLDENAGELILGAEQTEREARAKVAFVLEAMRLNSQSYAVCFALWNAGDVRLTASGELVDCGRLAVLVARTTSIEEACADRETYVHAQVPELILRARMLLIGFPEDATPIVVAVA